MVVGPDTSTSALRTAEIAAFSSACSFALIDRLMTRLRRSIVMILASTSSPTLNTVDASSIRSTEISDTFRVPSMPSASSITAALASTEITLPFTIVPLSFAAAYSAKGSLSSCLIPREIRSFSASIERITASTSSPFLNWRRAASASASQVMSDM